MKTRIAFALNTLGWLLIFIALMMGAVVGVGSDDELYYELQMRAGILDFAGVSGEDLRILDQRLSDYLFMPMNADAAFDNREMEVNGEMQPPFNGKELIHLRDCRKLLSPTAQMRSYVLLAGAGLILALCGKSNPANAAWVASAVIMLPLGVFALWAAIDFSSAFAFFHRLLFTNDLWLLDPATDLLIRICPSSMFAGMGLRIALCAVVVLLGIPAVLTILKLISDTRKRKAT